MMICTDVSIRAAPAARTCTERGFALLAAASSMGVPVAQVARLWGYNPHTARRYVQYARAAQGRQHQPVKQLPANLFDVNLGRPLELAGDAVVVGDVHANTTRLHWVERVVRVASRRRITRLIIGGDLVNMDQLSVHPRIVQPAVLARELEAARSILQFWLDSGFEQIAWISGNHETRLNRWTAAALGDTHVRRLVLDDDRIITSQYAWCTLRSGGQLWRITHPASYSRIPLRTPATIATHVQMNVIAFHAHHLAKGWDPSGRYVVVEGGGLYHPDQMAYVALADRAGAVRMVNGFVTVIDGVADLYGDPPFTDWTQYD